MRAAAAGAPYQPGAPAAAGSADDVPWRRPIRLIRAGEAVFPVRLPIRVAGPGRGGIRGAGGPGAGRREPLGALAPCVAEQQACRTRSRAPRVAEPEAASHNGAVDRNSDVAVAVQALIARREAALSPFAARSSTSRGRERPEPPPPLRGEYQRDRDRILHSKAFRRLKHKTQVFIAPTGDHFVTRLTHTLEVAQIARTIARALNLNEDLTEAAALGHDIGHAPFGHAGEQALSEALGVEWRHNEHGLRVVERVENEGRGLNLMWETREAILKSSKLRADISAEAWGVASTLEGQIVKVADAVAYINHDIADAIRAGLLAERDLPSAARTTLGGSHHDRVETLVTDIVRASWAASGTIGDGVTPVIALSPPMLVAANELREFLFERVYLPEDDLAQVRDARTTVQFLLTYFRAHPHQTPGDFAAGADPPELRALDYVAGMTDRFALRTAAALGCEAAVRAGAGGWHARPGTA